MATLTIHNIPDDLLERLKRSAMERGLSVEDEAVRRITSTSFPTAKHGDGETIAKQEPDPWLERARKLRESMPDVYIGDEEELNRFKREGRLSEYGSAYSIAPSRFSSPMKPEEFIEYTQQLSRKLEGKVWATEEEVNRAKREGRL